MSGQRPTAGELLAIARQRFQEDILPHLPEARRYTALMIANVMGIAEREAECRAGDEATRALLTALDDPAAADCVRAERALLAALDGSCRTPIGGLATYGGGGGRTLALEALIATPDGGTVHRAGRQGGAADAADMGRDLGEELRARAGPGFFTEET